MSRSSILIALSALLVAFSAAYADHREIIVNTGGELRDAFLDLQDGDEIVLADGSYTPIGPGGQERFIITDPDVHVTIRAQNPGGATIDGSGTRRLFEILVSSPAVAGWLTFEDLVFANGSSDVLGTSGGLDLDGVRATFVDCEFIDNEAVPAQPGGGTTSGAITVTNGGFVQFVRTEFRNNTSDNHAGAMLVGQGSTVAIHDSIFENNRNNVPGHRPNALGGAIHAFNTAQGTTTRLTVTNTRFSANHAGFVGGAIMAKGNFDSVTQPVESPTEVTVANSTFDGNTAAPDPGVTPAGTTEGGAIMIEDNASVTVHTSRFTGNSAGFGGAISTYRGSIDVSDSEFHDNAAVGLASTATAGRGGTLMAHSSDPCTDTQNFPSASLTVSDSLLANGTGQLGGCIYVSGDTNKQFGSGAGCPQGTLAQNRSPMILERTVLSGCTVDDVIGSHGYGGGIRGFLTDATVTDSLFLENEAHGTDPSNPASSSQGHGGAFTLLHASRLALTGSTFADNVADHEGGAIHLIGVEISTFTQNSFHGNAVSPGQGRPENQSEGAAIHAKHDLTRGIDVSGEIADSTFSDHDGLAIYERDQTDCGAGCGYNLLTYAGNTFHESSYGSKVYFNNLATPGAKTVSELNALIINRGAGNTTDKVPANDLVFDAGSIVSAAMVAAPPAIVSPTANGDPDPTSDVWLGWAWNGGCAELDSQNLPTTTGLTERTATGLSTLSAWAGACSGTADDEAMVTVLAGATPNASLTANPVAIAHGETSTLSWDVLSGAFLTGLVTNDADDDVAGPSGQVVMSPAATTTYRFVTVTEQGGDVDEATVFVDDPADDLIFLDGFESGDLTAWSSASP